MAPNRLELSNQDRWAEPLDNNFKQVIAQDLTQLLGTHAITFFPWPGTTRVDYQVRIDVYRFETDSAANAQLVAHWQVLDGSGKLLFANDSNLNEQASRESRWRPFSAERCTRSRSRSPPLFSRSRAAGSRDRHNSGSERSEPLMIASELALMEYHGQHWASFRFR